MIQTIKTIRGWFFNGMSGHRGCTLRERLALIWSSILFGMERNDVFEGRVVSGWVYHNIFCRRCGLETWSLERYRDYSQNISPFPTTRKTYDVDDDDEDSSFEDDPYYC